MTISKLALFTLLVMNMIMTSACAPPEGFDGPSDADFIQYIDKFIELSGSSAFTVPINFGKTSPIELGKCQLATHLGETYRRIIINKTRWVNLSHDRRRYLIFHELAHCALNRGHDNSTLSNGCPASIMHYKAVQQQCIDMHDKHYMNELFN